MNKFPPDLLIYVLIFLGIVLFNYVMKQAARRQQQDEPVPEQPPAQDEPLEEIFGRARPVPAAEPLRAAPPVRARVREAQALAAEVPRRRSAARSLLKGRGDLRRAIVVMTVLGPCRAQEPA